MIGHIVVQETIRLRILCQSGTKHVKLLFPISNPKLLDKSPVPGMVFAMNLKKDIHQSVICTLRKDHLASMCYFVNKCPEQYSYHYTPTWFTVECPYVSLYPTWFQLVFQNPEMYPLS